MCGQDDLGIVDDLAGWMHNLRTFDSGLTAQANRGYDHFIVISGRRWGKSRNHDLNVQWPLELPPDDRPLGEILDEHFRQRFERSERAPHDFQDLYDVPGAL